MKTAVLAILTITLGGCVGSGSMYETTGSGIVVSGGAAVSSGGSGGVSSGTVIATGGAIALDRPRYIEGCHVSPGESWLKCQTTADGTPRTEPVPAAEMPAWIPKAESSDGKGTKTYPARSAEECRQLAVKLEQLDGKPRKVARIDYMGLPGPRRYSCTITEIKN